MAKERQGYIGQEKDRWFARVTFTDSSGKRQNKKRIVKTESEAKSILKKLLKQIETEGEKGFEAVKLV
jgi:hypothetical protein